MKNSVMSITIWNNKRKSDKEFQNKNISGWFSIVQEISKLYDTYFSSNFEILSLKILRCGSLKHTVYNSLNHFAFKRPSSVATKITFDDNLTKSSCSWLSYNSASLYIYPV